MPRPSIPCAKEALEACQRPRRTHASPKACERALTIALNAVARAIAGGMTSVVVDVPSFVFGEPRFRIDDVADYVRKTLEERGYWVVTYPNSPSIAIGWSVSCSSHKTTTNETNALPKAAPAVEDIAVPFDVGL